MKQLYTVVQVDHRDANMYRPKEDDGKPVKGRFYEPELSPFTGEGKEEEDD
mgnify:CR=1 FL=1